MEDNGIVYILGAGCSACGQYPLAKYVPARMAEFAQGLGDDAVLLRGCVERTVDLLGRHSVKTLDGLAEVLFNVDQEALNEAKMATSAFFLYWEEHAVKLAYPSYRALFEELLGCGRSVSLKSKMANAPSRVVTYNYDRLFERSYIKWAKSLEPDYPDVAGDIHQLLGTGLGDIREVQLDSSKFCFVKLHGGAGQYYRDTDGGFRYPYRPQLSDPIPAMTDDFYHSHKGHERDTPLLMFPVEKAGFQFLSKPESRRWSFPLYNDAIWKAASQLCEKASEIKIVGYSMQPTDRAHFKEYLIQPAKNCKKITIRNRASERVELEQVLLKMRSELGAIWEIEFDDRDFTVPETPGQERA